MGPDSSLATTLLDLCQPWNSTALYLCSTCHSQPLDEKQSDPPKLCNFRQLCSLTEDFHQLLVTTFSFCFVAACVTNQQLFLESFRAVQVFWVTSEYLPLADISLAGAPVILPYGSPTPDTSVRSPRTSPTIGGRFSLFVFFLLPASLTIGWVISGFIPLADISLSVAPVILPYGPAC